VGRFGDSCTRIRFADIQVIDKKAELQSNAKLFKFASELSKKNIQLKPVAVKEVAQKAGGKKKKEDATTNTTTNNNGSRY
jgi:hypothetical protein